MLSFFFKSPKILSPPNNNCVNKFDLSFKIQTGKSAEQISSKSNKKFAKKGMQTILLLENLWLE